MFSSRRKIRLPSVVSMVSAMFRPAFASSSSRTTKSAPGARNGSNSIPGYFAENALASSLYDAPAREVYQVSLPSVLAPAYKRDSRSGPRYTASSLIDVGFRSWVDPSDTVSKKANMRKIAAFIIFLSLPLQKNLFVLFFLLGEFLGTKVHHM